MTIEDPKEKSRLKITRRILIGLFLFGLLIAGIVLGFYYYKFGCNRISTDPAMWGSFGDFVGGLLNSTFSFFALLGLLWTIFQNQHEIILSRQEMRRSSQALIQSKEIADRGEKREQKKEIKEDLFRMINLLHIETKESLHEKVYYARQSEYVPILHVIEAQYLGSVELKKVDVENIASYLFKIGSNLESLKQYLENYVRLSNNSSVEVYFKKYFTKPSTYLESMPHGDFISQEAVDYFSNISCTLEASLPP